MSVFHLEILTPYGNYLSKDVDYLEVRNEDSVIGILPHHTPIISTIKMGKMRIKINGKFFVYATSGGVLNVKQDGSVVLLLSTIERNDEINIQRAREALLRAQSRLENKSGDIARAQLAVERATNRLKVAEGSDE